MLEKLDRFINSVMEKKKLVGSSIAVVKGDEVVWSKGYGYSNLEEEVRATPETVYRCASVTKPVITVGLLQWMERECIFCVR